MTRSLKSLGLLVGALLVLLGLMASAASAHVPARFTSEQAVTTARGANDAGTPTTFKVTGQEVSCTNEEYHFTAVGTSLESVKSKAVYTECTAFGFVNAKITGFGHYPAVEGAGPYCEYLLTANGTVHLVCPAGKDLTVEASTCTVHVPAQEGLGTVQFTTGTWEGKHAVTLDVNVGSITATATDGFACPLTGSGDVTNCTIIGKTLVWGEDPTTHEAVGITWDATTA
jgi:hypothetical protein